MTEPVQQYAHAVEALNRGDWGGALQRAERLLPVAPGHAGVHFVAGVAALHLQQLPRALRHLESSVRLNPTRPDYAAQWARALSAAAMTREAIEVARRALALEPGDTMTLDTLGVVFTLANAHEEAVQAFWQATRLNPAVASYHFNLATSLSILNRMEEAEQEYEACLARDPRYWKAHLALAQLRRQTSGSNHLARLNSLLVTTGDDREGRMYVNLALAKELEDLGEFPDAFDRLVDGKRAGRGGRVYRPGQDKALFDAVIEAFPGEPPAEGGFDTAEPIFVIGMPRTGTTLVDRILGSHPKVQSAGELPNFGYLVKRMSGSHTGALLDADTLAMANEIDPAALGRAYVDSTRPGTGQCPHFIDKLPHNFLYAGLIAKALPKARIICLRRDPMDTCLSNFRQLFAQGSAHYDYSFDLIDTARYYLQFDRLMAHWSKVLPERLFEVRYEDIVEDQALQTRRLLEFCGLDWSDSCLAFEKNSSPVATASLAQVRSPLYRTAVGRWKRYKPQLTELAGFLASHGVSVH